MTRIGLFHLYVMRVFYLLLVLGLGSIIWPEIINHKTPWSFHSGVRICLFVALSALAVFGLRHPVKMMPLLVFEIIWKLIWLSVVALPAWQSGTLDAATRDTTFECLAVLVFIPVIPWGAIFAAVITSPGDRWR